MEHFCKLEVIPVASVEIDHSYQRPTNMPRVKKIVATYNEHRDRPIEVSYRDGKYWVFDGQHRLEAAKLRKQATIKAQVHYGLSYMEECMLFANQHKDQRGVSAADQWRAAVESGALCVEVQNIRAIAKNFGLTIDPKNTLGKNVISCPATLRSFYRKFGSNGLKTIFFVITSAWRDLPQNTDARIIGAFETIYSIYGKRMKDQHWNHLRDAMMRTTPQKILQQSAGTKAKARTALTIMKEYNRGLRRSGGNYLDYAEIVSKYGI